MGFFPQHLLLLLMMTMCLCSTLCSTLRGTLYSTACITCGAWLCWGLLCLSHVGTRTPLYYTSVPEPVTAFAARSTAPETLNPCMVDDPRAYCMYYLLYVAVARDRRWLQPLWRSSLLVDFYSGFGGGRALGLYIYILRYVPYICMIL